MESSVIEKSVGVVNVAHCIGGKWSSEGERFDVVSPGEGCCVTRAPQASEQQVAKAVSAATAAKAAMAAMPGYERAALLRRFQAALSARADDVAVSLTRETGKVIRETREELRRALDVLGLCAEEAIRIEGSHVPLDGSANGAGKIAMMLRFPVGVVAGIVPFNAAANLTCHKVGPALAAGNPVVIKSPPEAPNALALIFEALCEAQPPEGAVSLLHGKTQTGEALVNHPGVDFITFTGSTRAGAAVKKAAGMRRVLLELGGLGPNIVHADADVDRAAKLTAQHGTRLAGQSCISVQNLFVHRSIVERFLDMHVATVKAMSFGDPMNPETQVGPLINERAAVRVESWLREAAAGGARLLCGGKRHGALVEPTVVTDAKPEMKIVCEEIFGPVIVVRPYDDIAEPIAWINSSDFGLNCGVFTSAIDVALRAVRQIECGGVILNGSSTFRPDQVPYGGIKNSGIGREGPRYAIREMTNERLIVFAQ